MKICISLCTRNRPKMLGQCLDSLVPALAAADSETFVIVVENSARPDCEAVVQRFAGRLDITYLMEPEPGIPFARNRGIEAALARGFDWLIFIDDDEFVQPDWLAVLAAAPARFAAEVFSGPRLRVCPPGTPAWFPRDLGETRLPTGTARQSAYTANTMAAARLFRADGLNLRFDPRFRMTGGSDTDLFRRFTRGGGKIIWIDEAVLSEEFPVARMTLRWNWDRHVRMTNNVVFMERYHLGNARGRWQAVKSMAGMLPMTFARLLAGLLRYPFDPVTARRHLFMAAMKCAGIWGFVLGLLGREVNPYRKTEGS